VYRLWWRLVEGSNCFWFCHTCGSSPFSYMAYFAHRPINNLIVSFLIYLPPTPSIKNPTWSGNFHHHISFIYWQIPINSVIYTTNGIRRVLKHKLNLGSTGIYNSYCARRRNSRMDDIVRKSSLTSRVFVHELLLRLLRLSSNFSSLIRYIYRYQLARSIYYMYNIFVYIDFIAIWYPSRWKHFGLASKMYCIIIKWYLGIFKY